MKITNTTGRIFHLDVDDITKAVKYYLENRCKIPGTNLDVILEFDCDLKYIVAGGVIPELLGVNVRSESKEICPTPDSKEDGQ